MSERKVELRLRPAGVGCELLIDGEPAKNVKAVTVRAEVGQVTTVVVELVNVDVVVAGEAGEVSVADVTALDDETRRYVRA